MLDALVASSFIAVLAAIPTIVISVAIATYKKAE